MPPDCFRADSILYQTLTKPNYYKVYSTLRQCQTNIR